MRAFLAVVEDRTFGEAAARLRMSQQAVSKRIAALERDLGVRLFTRTPRGAVLTVDGQAFLPHARRLIRAADRAVASVRAGSRALRVDVLNRRIGPASLLRDFHRAHPEIGLDVVTLDGADVTAAVAAVEAGTVDATFRAVAAPLPPGIRAARVLDDPHQLLTGPAHSLAAARRVSMVELSDVRIWIPGIVAGTEWAAYYDALSAAFGVTVEPIGPNFGTDHLLDVLADSPVLTSLVGARTRMVWPDAYDLRRIPIVGPAPVYPHFLIWHADNPHPGLAAFRHWIGRVPGRHLPSGAWVPEGTAPPGLP